MNTRLVCLLCTAVVLTVGLPSAHVRSQSAPPSGDAMADLQTMQTANDDLIRRQEATLKDLADTTEVADQVRIFSKRG